MPILFTLLSNIQLLNRATDEPQRRHAKQFEHKPAESSLRYSVNLLGKAFWGERDLQQLLAVYPFKAKDARLISSPSNSADELPGAK